MGLDYAAPRQSVGSASMIQKVSDRLTQFFQEDAEERERVIREEGLKIHAVTHPIWGVVDEIWVSGRESAEELAAFEAASFRRLGINPREAKFEAPLAASAREVSMIPPPCQAPDPQNGADVRSVRALPPIPLKPLLRPLPASVRRKFPKGIRQASRQQV